MKFPSTENRTGLSTIVLAGVVFNAISPWWIIAGVLLILMGTGLESGKAND